MVILDMGDATKPDVQVSPPSRERELVAALNQAALALSGVILSTLSKSTGNPDEIGRIRMGNVFEASRALETIQKTRLALGLRQ